MTQIHQMQNRSFLVFIIVAAVVVVAMPFFFMFYREQVSYYIEEDYDYLARLIFMPLAAIAMVVVTYKSVRADLRRDTFKWKDYFKQLPWFLTGMAAVFLLAGSVFSSMLLYVNMHFGTPESYWINGRIVGKYEFRGKGARFEFTILNENDGKCYKFKTTWREIDKYKINHRFEKEMKKGFFGFVYSE